MRGARAARRLTWPGIALYLACFFAIWTLRELFVRRPMQALLGVWLDAFVSGGVKLLLWTAPAFWLVWRYPGGMEVTRLFAGRVHWPRLLLGMAGFFLYSVAMALLTHGGLWIQPDFAPVDLIGTVLFVGITEEAVFRGLLLNTFAKRMEKPYALALSAFLFVLIHFPIWYTRGLFETPFLLFRSSLSIFALGILFGFSFLADRNLISPILLHMAWNLGAVLFFG